MKHLLPLALGLAAATTLVLSPERAAAQSPNDMVRVEVKVQATTEHKGSGKTIRSEPVEQDKTMDIEITGKPKTPETRTGKWMIYGRDEKGHAVSVVDSGDFKIELPVSGPQKVESKKVSMNYTPSHNQGGGGGKGKPKAGKKVEATGTKYAGYGVVVMDGDKVVGEAYDPMGIKTEANK